MPRSSSVWKMRRIVLAEQSQNDVEQANNLLHWLTDLARKYSPHDGTFDSKECQTTKIERVAFKVLCVAGIRDDLFWWISASLCILGGGAVCNS